MELPRQEALVLAMCGATTLGSTNVGWRVGQGSSCRFVCSATRSGLWEEEGARYLLDVGRRGVLPPGWAPRGKGSLRRSMQRGLCHQIWGLGGERRQFSHHKLAVEVRRCHGEPCVDVT